MSQTMQLKIRKWGNSLGLPVTGIMRAIPQLEEGAAVDVEIFEDGFTVRKAKPKSKVVFPFSEKELLAGITAASAHADALATLSAKELGNE